MSITGLTYKQNVVSEKEELQLIELIDSLQWSNALQRRVQQYGFEYSYGYGASVKKTTDIPDFLKKLMNELGIEANQIIINEYLPGQGINAHTDHKTLFGDTIYSLSLGSSCVMTFKYFNNTKHVLLERKSLVILQDDARYKWTHEIAQRKKDAIENSGLVINRGRRISITFRNVV